MRAAASWPDGTRVRLATNDRFHNRTGTVVGRRCVLPLQEWLIVSVDPRKEESPSLLYVGYEEVRPITDSPTKRSKRISPNSASSETEHPWRKLDEFGMRHYKED